MRNNTLIFYSHISTWIADITASGTDFCPFEVIFQHVRSIYRQIVLLLCQRLNNKKSSRNFHIVTYILIELWKPDSITYCTFERGQKPFDSFLSFSYYCSIVILTAQLNVCIIWVYKKCQVFSSPLLDNLSMPHIFILFQG